MIDNLERDALNLIRWLSAISIVVCHLLQGLGNDYAWIFNAGVQVFFILSGFLYGSKRITCIKKFYTGRLLKLYIPYLIWVIVSVLLITCFSPYDISAREFGLQILMLQNISGLDHLWFMRTIFICYLFLPICDRFMTNNSIVTITLFVIISSIILMVCYRPGLVWITLYYLGYILGRYRRIIPYTFTISLLIFIPLAALSDDFIKAFKLANVSSVMLHSLLGIIIFLGILLLIRRINMPSAFSHLLANWGGTKCT